MTITGDGEGTAARPDPPPGASRPAAGFAAVSALGLVVLLAAGAGPAALAALLTGPVLALDRAVAAAVNGLVGPRPELVAVLQAITPLGDDRAGAIVLGTLAVALVIRGRPRLAAYVVVTGLGAAVLGPVLKLLVGRLRPVVDVPVATAPGPSFPSGHALAATVWVGVVLLVLLPAVALRARRTVVAVGVVLVVAVGLTRIGLGVHHLTDVLAGWLLGATWLAVTATAFRTWLHGPGPRPHGAGLDPGAARDLAPAPDHRTPAVSPWVRAARLLSAAVLVVGAVLAAGLVITRTAVGAAVTAFDLAVLDWLVAHRTPALDALSLPVGELGNTTVVITLGIVTAVIGLAVARRWRAALLMAALLLGELALFVVAATVTGRSRPPVPHLDAELPPTSSFPSGHTTAALCLYGGVAVLVCAATRSRWRWPVVGAAVAVVVLVAASRLYRGAHHPSDVLGSVLLGVPWLLACAGTLGLPGRATDPEEGATRGGSTRGSDPGRGTIAV